MCGFGLSESVLDTVKQQRHVTLKTWQRLNGITGKVPSDKMD